MVVSSSEVYTDTSFQYFYTYDADSKDYSMCDHNAVITYFEKSVDEAEKYFKIRLDETPFFAEKGGQHWDKGKLIFQNGTSINVSSCVEVREGIIDILCEYDESLMDKICIRDQVTCIIDMKRRSALSRSHTSQHILNYALTSLKLSEDAISCAVSQDTFTMDINKILSKESLLQGEDMANRIVSDSLPIYMKQIPKDQALEIPGMKFKSGYDYPDSVRVVSIGYNVSEEKSSEYFSNFFEMCCGTHVHNTGHIRKIVLTDFFKAKPGVYRMTAVCGRVAEESLRNGKELIEDLKELEPSLEKLDSMQLEEVNPIIKKINLIINKFQTCIVPMRNKSCIQEKFEKLRLAFSKRKTILLKEYVDKYFEKLAVEIEALELPILQKVFDDDDLDKKMIAALLKKLGEKYPLKSFIFHVIPIADDKSFFIDVKINKSDIKNVDAKEIGTIWKDFGGKGGGSEIMFKGEISDRNSAFKAFESIKKRILL